jgi:hypothetical protein
MCTPVVLAVMAALGAAAPSPPPSQQPAAATASSHAATGETVSGKAATLAATAPTVCMIYPDVPAAE